MIVTKEQLADIIQLAKVMIDNHPEEVEGNPSIVKRIKVLSSLKDASEIEVTNNLNIICNDAAGTMSIESYSALINDSLKRCEVDETFKEIVDENEDINVPKAVTLISCYLRYVLTSEVLKLIKR